jgi:DNA-binding PadR family transcriptional regulator
MSRVFRRGELKEAIVIVLAALGEAHGYAIMGALKERVGGGWKPSPGAIYPALLALEETGHVETVDRDGTRTYALTDLGREAAHALGSEGRWSALTARAEQGETRVAVGSLLDRFASGSPLRRRLASVDQRKEIDEILGRVGTELEELLTRGENDG